MAVKKTKSTMSTICHVREPSTRSAACLLLAQKQDAKLRSHCAGYGKLTPVPYQLYAESQLP
jgi:hypothetical protein